MVLSDPSHEARNAWRDVVRPPLLIASVACNSSMLCVCKQGFPCTSFASTLLVLQRQVTHLHISHSATTVTTATASNIILLQSHVLGPWGPSTTWTHKTHHAWTHKNTPQWPMPPLHPLQAHLLHFHVLGLRGQVVHHHTKHGDHVVGVRLVRDL